MAWNRPDSTGLPLKRPNPKRKYNIRYCLGIVALLSLSCACFVFLNKGQDNQSCDSKSGVVSKQIKELPPKHSTTNKHTDVEVGKTNSTAVTTSEWKPKAEGFCFDPEGTLYRNGKKVRTSKIAHRKAPCEIFNYHSENLISLLMNTEPGTVFFGPGNYQEGFVRNFEKSCQEPIIVFNTDSDEVKRLKRDMIDVKIELKERMRQGESLTDIISSTRNELQKLGQVKLNLQRMLKSEVKTNAKSAADVDTFIEAADRILEEKGIAPLKDNPILRHNLMRIVNVDSDELEKTDNQ